MRGVLCSLLVASLLCVFSHITCGLLIAIVYNCFDQVMILSKGREAFTGDVSDAAPYFEEIGYPLPAMTNPAEHFLDLVNADFSDDAEVDKILDTWEEKRPEAGSSHHDGPKGTSGQRANGKRR